jgi:hypothetical protein
MFGNVRACRHRLGADHGRWVAALCGVCVAVGEAAGHLPRALVVTDAVALSVLAAEGRGTPVGVVDVGPCPLRGMRPATVLAPDDRATQVGVAGALLAAWARLQDAADDGDLRGGRAAAKAARVTARRLRPPARAAATAAGVDLAAFDAAMADSAAVERTRPADLDAWTDPSSAATAAVVAGLARDPDDVGSVTAIGRRIGRATLLADAVADLRADAARDRPNPILAGAVDLAGAAGVVRDDARAVADAVAARCGATSVSATVWGACWRAGLEHAMRPSLGADDRRTRRRHLGAGAAPAIGLAAVVLASTGPAPGFTWSGVPQEDPSRRQGCCDACDCCTCSCDCCDCCDTCDCCDCDCGC